MDSDIHRKIDSFFSAYRLQKFSKGQILVQAGEDPPGIFYLASGHVRQYDISKQGDEVVVNVFKPRAFFPMSWAINRTPNQYFFEAATTVSLRVAPADEAVKFLQDNPDVAFDLISRVYSGVDGLLRRMAHLMGGSARTRLLFELLIECRRFGKKQADGSYVINLHEDELAARAGLSRETISRELRKIKKSGLIIVNRQGFRIRDVDWLEKKLGSNL